MPLRSDGALRPGITAMGTWLVPVIGHEWDIRELIRFSTDDPRFVQENGRTFLTSTAFSDLDDINDVYDRAVPMIEVAIGAASLAEIQVAPVRLDSDAIYILDSGERREYPKAPEGLRAWVHPGEPQDPRIVEGQHRVAKKALTYGLANPAIEQVLRLWAAQPRTWAGLYVLLDLVEKYVGQTASEVGWISKNEWKRFRHSASNSPVRVEEVPRHGAPRGSTPKNPMSLRDAEELIRKVIGLWILALR
jgi:hypothetical protein